MKTTRNQLQCKIQSAGGTGGNSRGEDPEPIGVTVSGASGADRALAEGRPGAIARTFSWMVVRGNARDGEFDAEALYEEIGRLKMELEWLKKKAGMLE